MGNLSLANATALPGTKSVIDQRFTFPRNSLSSEVNPWVGEMSAWSNLVDIAVGKPAVDDADWLPPISFMEDFIVTASTKAAGNGKFAVAADSTEWFVTEVDGATGQTETVLGKPIDGAAGASAQGGWAEFTSCNADNDGLTAVQANGEAFKLASGKPLWFEARLAIKDISITELFIGLAISTTNAYGTAGAGDTGGHVGFVSKADGNIMFNVMESGGTLSATDTATDFVDGSITTFETANVVHRLSFYWDGVDTITPYVDGVAIAAAAVTDAVGSEIPDGVCMSPVFGFLTNTTTSPSIWIDYIGVVQER